VTEHISAADETTERLERSVVAEGLARVGVAVGAQRTELYQHLDDRAELVGWWAALGFEVPPPSEAAPIPLNWFPWTLGNIRQAHHVFVRNAGPLPLCPGSADRIRDLRMGSSLHLPITASGTALGAICAYWSHERDDWDADQAETLAQLGRDLLEQVS
jgi:GAF domain-containing protein